MELERSTGIRQIFLDTAPIIYFVEKDARYLDALRSIFKQIAEGELIAVTSPITLAECLVVPCRQKQTELIQCFNDLIVSGNNTIFVPISEVAARKAAELRAQYNLTLTDALQVAICLTVGCDAFLTNDKTLKRVKEINAIVLSD